MGRKIYVRPNARKGKPKKRKAGQLTTDGRARQKAAMSAYWARWRKEHGKEEKGTPLTTESSAEISKGFAEAVIEIHKERVLSEEAYNLFHSVGMKFGYALGKTFGDALIDGIKRAQQVRQKGNAEGPRPPT